MFDGGETGRAQPGRIDGFIEKLKYRRSPGLLEQKMKGRYCNMRGSLAPDLKARNNGSIERHLKRDFVKKTCFHTTE